MYFQLIFNIITYSFKNNSLIFKLFLKNIWKLQKHILPLYHQNKA